MGLLEAIRFRRHGLRARLVGSLPSAARLVGNLADLLQVLPRRRHDLVDAQVVGNAVDLIERLLARLAVIDLVRAGDRLVAVEPVEHLEIGRDGRHGPHLHYGLYTNRF